MLGLVLVRKAGVKTYIVVSSITPSIRVFRGCGRGQVMMYDGAKDDPAKR